MTTKLKLFMKTAIWLSLMFLFGNGLSAQTDNYPIKSAGYWTKPTMGINEIINLSKHDLLIVDLENKFNNYKTLQALKKLNPKLKLICYSNPMEIFLTKYATRPWQNKVIDEIVNNYSPWLLKIITPIQTTQSSLLEILAAKILNAPKYQESYANFWPGMIILNMSAVCPKIEGKNYSAWMANKLNKEILSDSIWDGYFMDNCTANIAWSHPGLIDIDGDKQNDSDLEVDKNWKQGIANYVSNIKKGKEKNFIMIGNKGDLNFLDKTNNKFFENFPNDHLGDKWAYGFRQCLKNADKMGNYTVFQANRTNIKFVLASALLLDNVYVAVSQDDGGYFPELNINPGKPIGPYQEKNGIYYRQYEKADILVDPLKGKANIILKK